MLYNTCIATVYGHASPVPYDSRKGGTMKDSQVVTILKGLLCGKWTLDPKLSTQAILRGISAILELQAYKKGGIN